MKFENEKETHLEKAAPSSIVDFLVVICNCHEFERSQGGKGIRLRNWCGPYLRKIMVSEQTTRIVAHECTSHPPILKNCLI